MRRLALLTLSLVALLPAAPSSAGTGVCVSSRGVTACPVDVMRCTPGDIIRVNVTGVGTGTAACGTAEASCGALRGLCSQDAATTAAGEMTCAATGSAVATCSIVVQVTH